MAIPPPKSEPITRRIEWARLLDVPFLPWVVVTIAALFVSTKVINTDAIFDAACDRFRNPGYLDSDDLIVTYILLSIGWLGVSFYRGCS